jgi:hypothetical protein
MNFSILAKLLIIISPRVIITYNKLFLCLLEVIEDFKGTFFKKVPLAGVRGQCPGKLHEPI